MMTQCTRPTHFHSSSSFLSLAVYMYLHLKKNIYVRQGLLPCNTMSLLPLNTFQVKRHKLLLLFNRKYANFIVCRINFYAFLSTCVLFSWFNESNPTLFWLFFVVRVWQVELNEWKKRLQLREIFTLHDNQNIASAAVW